MFLFVGRAREIRGEVGEILIGRLILFPFPPNLCSGQRLRAQREGWELSPGM